MASIQPNIEIVPSVLPANFAELGRECSELEQAGVDRIQFDVMDGQFVPNITFGADVIASVRSAASVPFEAHLMINNPENYVSDFVEAGCEIIIVHAEACTHLHRVLNQIKDLGAKPAVALNPHTPLEQITNVLDLLDMILVMTVNPGFGGQSYISTMEPKVKAARNLITDSERNIDLQVDGGIKPNTISGAAKAGANIFISGTGIYNHPQGKEFAVKELRQLAQDSFSNQTT